MGGLVLLWSVRRSFLFNEKEATVKRTKKKKTRNDSCWFGNVLDVFQHEGLFSFTPFLHSYPCRGAGRSKQKGALQEPAREVKLPNAHSGTLNYSTPTADEIYKHEAPVYNKQTTI